MHRKLFIKGGWGQIIVSKMYRLKAAAAVKRTEIIGLQPPSTAGPPPTAGCTEMQILTVDY